MSDVTLERYDLVEKLASGGMGEVFRAVAHGAHGFSKDLAVKRILPEYARDPEFERRFVAEAKLAVKLTHANIVSVLDFGHMAGSLYLAMEYVDGVDLAALLSAHRRRGEPVPVHAIVHIAAEVVKGLDFAHRRDVVHRDISPSNLLLSRAGEVKIADFGIARAVSGKSTGQVTSAGDARIVGKLRYMSPEQITGGTVDAQSDLFSLGIVLWELCTGERLITGRDLHTATEQICDRDQPPLAERRGDLPAEFCRAVDRMLERDRSARWDSAKQLLGVMAKCAYALDPIPTAEDVSTVVEAAVDSRADSEELDDAILAQLGVDGHIEPSRVTRARGKGRAGTAGGFTHTVSLFRQGVDARGVPQWRTDATGATAAVAAESVDRTGDRTIDVANVSVETAITRRSRVGLWLALPVVAAGAVAVVVGLIAGDDSRPVRSEQTVATAAADGAATAVAPTEPAESPDAAVAAAPARGALHITSKPSGAAIEVGGEDVGKTPATLDFDPGEIRFTVTRRGYKPEKRTVTVVAGETTDVSLDLDRAKGTISLFSHPWAYVYYRGRKVGQTPIRRLELPAGSHSLTLENPVLGRKKRIRVRVPRSKPYRVSLE